MKRAVRNAVAGRGHVDKLAKVWLTTGQEVWIVIHIEVQTQKDGQFELRMYVYNYRIFDRYRRPVVSLAILADDDPSWRPNAYGYELMACKAGLNFPNAKLNDFRARMTELETSPNPFAVLVLAHLRTQETHRSPEQRLSAKIALIRGLRRRGLDRTQILELFRLIHGMMILPEDLEQRFESDVAEIEKEENMPYKTPWEKKGYAEGLEKGALDTAHENLLAVLIARFDRIPETLIRALQHVADLERLKSLVPAASRARSLEDFIREL